MTTIRRLAEVIKTKYQVLVITREAIPRQEVRQYIAAIQTILQKHLRDYCSECGHNMEIMTDVFHDLEQLSSI